MGVAAVTPPAVEIAIALVTKYGAIVLQGVVTVVGNSRRSRSKEGFTWTWMQLNPLFEKRASSKKLITHLILLQYRS